MNAQEHIADDRQPVLSDEFSDADNVVDFTTTLRELKKQVDPDLIRHREAWRDRSGNLRLVEYVEWHTVADILDRNAPNWGHQVKDIRTIGDFVIVTVAISIDGVTREGIGTGSSRSETGIKKAEHDALKRAAVKFGIARDLYKREMTGNEIVPLRTEDYVDEKPFFDGDPVAQTIAEMVTPKQLGMIRAVARECGVDPERECTDLMNCSISELSRRAASALIDHLRSIERPEKLIRKAG